MIDGGLFRLTIEESIFKGSGSQMSIKLCGVKPKTGNAETIDAFTTLYHEFTEFVNNHFSQWLI